ncbi:stage III sporulation protein AF [Paenibacillus harenae]|uniref:stage III sporulation protein AF n=1 Tax=Paenibacillus harenae TaxID=306543 RepID=UPI00041DB2B2|nr:stage III sporulation protein AF [Paenibacillus harenae]
MVAWLSDWLRDIIAVILLAVFVELLLPNKAMQRYARLVVGLFILLTILSPILKLLQTDISAKLDEGMGLWSEAAMTRKVPMADLSQIQRDAEQLSGKRTQEAAKLAERTLEASIKSELVERAKAPVDKVDAVLKWVEQSGSRTPSIHQVIVTLTAADSGGGSRTDASPVEEVQPVSVAINIEEADGDEPLPGKKHNEPSGETEETMARSMEEGQWTEADPSTASAVRGVIEQGWGVNADRIVVRRPADEGASR